MSPTPDSGGLRRRLRIATLVLGGIAAGIVVLGAASRYVLLLVFEDAGEDQADVTIQLHRAASHIRQVGGAEFDGELVAMVVKGLGEDPWGHEYRFERSPRHAHTFRMFTLGADDRPGGQDRDEDIVVWVDLEFGAKQTYGLDQPPFGFVW